MDLITLIMKLCMYTVYALATCSGNDNYTVMLIIINKDN